MKAKPKSANSAIINSLFLVILFISFALLLRWNGMFVQILIDKLNMNDFGKIYHSTQTLINGEDIYGQNPATYLPVSDTQNKNFWNLNPPHLHIAIVPLALLSETSALIAWGLLNLVCLLVSIECIASEMNQRLSFKILSTLICAILLCSGTSSILVTGQFSFMLLLLFTLAWINARRNRWGWGGFFLGILISLKLFFLLFLPYLLLRQKMNSLIIALFTAVTIFVLGIAALGVECYVSWVAVLGKVDWHWAAMNGSLLGFLTRALSANPFYLPVNNLAHLIVPLWTCGFIVLGAITVLSAAFDDSKNSVDRGFAIILMASLIMSPLGWLYYIWMIAGPLTAMVYKKVHPVRFHHVFFTDCKKDLLHCVIIGCALVGALLPYPLTIVFQPNSLATMTVGSIYFWMFLAIWMLLYRDYMEKRTSPLYKAVKQFVHNLFYRYEPFANRSKDIDVTT